VGRSVGQLRQCLDINITPFHSHSNSQAGRYKMGYTWVISTVTLSLLVGGTFAGILENAAEAIECPQNLVVANKIGDKAFMQQQINCILGPDSACDDIGLKAKRIGPLVLSNHCPRPMCDECTKKAVRMVVARMQNNYPKEWFRIQQRLTRG